MRYRGKRVETLLLTAALTFSMSGTCFANETTAGQTSAAIQKTAENTTTGIDVATETEGTTSDQTTQETSKATDTTTEGATTTTLPATTEEATESATETITASGETSKTETDKKEQETSKKHESETTKKSKETSSKKKTTKKKTSTKKTAKKVVTPGKIRRAVADTSSDGVTVRWSKSTKTTGYYVYRSVNGGRYFRIAVTKKTSYADKDCVMGSTYRYKVKPYYKNKTAKGTGKAVATDKVTIQQKIIFDYKERQKEIGVPVIKDEGYIYPLVNWHPVTASFYETVYHSEPHNGTDIGAPQGTYIVAITDGVVQIANRTSARGNQVVINHDGDEYWSRYQHMAQVFVKAGEKVEKGQIIGTVGNTGNSTGPHLHIELGTGTNYESITSVLDGGSLFDAMLYLPTTYKEFTAQQNGTYKNAYFSKSGKVIASRKLVKQQMQKLKKAKKKKAKKKKILARNVLMESLESFREEILLNDFNEDVDQQIKKIKAKNKK